MTMATLRAVAISQREPYLIYWLLLNLTRSKFAAPTSLFMVVRV